VFFKKGIDLVIFEPTLADDSLDVSRLNNEFVTTNRKQISLLRTICHDKLKDVEDIKYTRDVFSRE
jgi:hypothetical protein